MNITLYAGREVCYLASGEGAWRERRGAMRYYTRVG